MFLGAFSPLCDSTVCALLLSVPVHLKETVVSKPPATSPNIMKKKNNPQLFVWNCQAGVNLPSGDLLTPPFLSDSSCPFDYIHSPAPLVPSLVFSLKLFPPCQSPPAVPLQDVQVKL